MFESLASLVSLNMIGDLDGVLIGMLKFFFTTGMNQLGCSGCLNKLDEEIALDHSQNVGNLCFD